MYIADVIGELREKQLKLSLEIAALRGTVNVLERFTWNMLKALEKSDPAAASAAVREAIYHGEYPVFDEAHVRSAFPAEEAGMGPAGSAS